MLDEALATDVAKSKSFWSIMTLQNDLLLGWYNYWGQVRATLRYIEVCFFLLSS